MKVNLGCGGDYRKGEEWINIDIDESVNPDIVHDLNEGIPLDSCVADYVLASHIIEHLFSIRKIMIEIHRICKPNAEVEIRVPHRDRFSAVRDKNHKHLFDEDSMNRFDGNGFELKNVELRESPFEPKRWILNKLQKGRREEKFDQITYFLRVKK